MPVARWNPWSDLFSLHEQMDQLFSQNMAPGPRREREVANLPVDIHQTDEAFYIEASIPGIRPEDVEVTFDERVVTIRAEAHDSDYEEDEARRDYVRRERNAHAYYRQVALPADVRSEDIRASFEHGVLTIEVPRARRAQPRRIPVSTGSARPRRAMEGPRAEADREEERRPREADRPRRETSRTR